MADSRPLLIIGAGASGMMAAIAASRVRPHSVLLLEKEARVGRKLLATGNGRCNLLNMRACPDAYHGSGAAVARGLLRVWTPARLREEFASLGLACREEAEGRVYPYSGQAAAVLDALRFACDRLGVRTQTESPVTSLKKTTSGFAVTTPAGTFSAARVILAGGGKAAPSFGADGNAYAFLTRLGHHVAPAFPTLAPLKLPAERIRGLKGVRATCMLTLLVDGIAVHTERGEALFTEYGISGVAAMQMARQVGIALEKKQSVRISIELVPEKMAREETERRIRLYAGDTMENYCTGLLHKRLGLCLLREAGLTPQTPVTADAAHKIEPFLTAWELPVLGTLSFAQAQATAGGAAMDAFDPETLESRRQPGLYACGEILDVDADCGGYNLMWAWASGLVAGEAAARSLEVRS